MRRLAALALGLAAAAAAAGLYVTRAQSLSDIELAGIEPDLDRGEWVFHAAGCASCHVAPDAERGDTPVLAGGRRFDTPFGTFVAPNISPHPEAGIGGWTDAEIVTALIRGTSPDGRHYYPAFPYSAYAKAELSDMVSLAAYLRTLPADATPSAPHDLAFPYNIRAGVGLWKMLYLDTSWAVEVADDPVLLQGRYISEALAHCGECHSPRDALGGLDRARWFAGAPNPSGDGDIPAIHPGALSWSEAEIAAYLSDGFTPEFDVAGGSMRAVIEGMARLSAEDRAAVAAYVRATLPVE